MNLARRTLTLAPLLMAAAQPTPPSADAPKPLLDERCEALLARITRVPVNQLQMMKLMVNQSIYQQGLHATQIIGTLLDGAARHTPEGHEFQRAAAAEGFREAVRRRDEPFGDLGPATYKG